MHQQVRMLKAVLGKRPVSIVDVCREAKVWPSTAKYFLENEVKLGRLAFAGYVNTRRKGYVLSLYAPPNDAAREGLKQCMESFTARDWGSLIDREVYSDLLEPPGEILFALTFAMPGRTLSKAERSRSVEKALDQWCRLSTARIEVYDDTGKGELMVSLYKKLLWLTYLLSKCEIEGTGICAAAFRHSFEELAGQFIFLSEEHTKVIANIARYWRDSPLFSDEVTRSAA